MNKTQEQVDDLANAYYDGMAFVIEKINEIDTLKQCNQHFINLYGIAPSDEEQEAAPRPTTNFIYPTIEQTHNHTMRFITYLASISDDEKMTAMMCVKVLVLISCIAVQFFTCKFWLLPIAFASLLSIISDILYKVNNSIRD